MKNDSTEARIRPHPAACSPRAVMWSKVLVRHSNHGALAGDSRFKVPFTRRQSGTIRGYSSTRHAFAHVRGPRDREAVFRHFDVDANLARSRVFG